MRRITHSDHRALKIGGLCALGILTAAGLISCGGDSSTPAATPSATPAPAAPAPAPAAPAPAAPLPTEVSGVIATGAAVANAAITVKDSDAVTTDITGTADANGAYKLDVSTLKPPLVVIATGTQNGEAVSIVAVVPTLTGNANNTANVTSLTNAIAALIAPGGDLNALSTPATLSSSASAAKVTDATALVVNTLKTDPVISALLGAG